MKAVLLVVAVLIGYMMLSRGVFGSLTTGGPAGYGGGGFFPPYGPNRFFSAQTPWGNFGGGF